MAGNAGCGGLVGYNEGAVTRCYATGAVSGGWGIGGLVGDNSGTVNTAVLGIDAK